MLLSVSISLDVWRVKNALTPVAGYLNTAKSIVADLTSSFQLSYGIRDPISLIALDYLKYRISEIENVQLPQLLKSIYMQTVIDPHEVIATIITRD